MTAPAPDPWAAIAAVLALVGQAVDDVVRVSPMVDPGQVLVADLGVLGAGGGRVVFVHPDDADRVRTAARAALFGGPWYASCDCGWESDMPCPGRGEASDEWADHIQETDQ